MQDEKERGLVQSKPEYFYLQQTIIMKTISYQFSYNKKHRQAKSVLQINNIQNDKIDLPQRDIIRPK